MEKFHQTKEKVCIVGSASTSESDAPYEDGSFELWGLGWRLYRRIDVLFDMHPLGPHRKNVPFEDYSGYLAGTKKPVFLVRAEDDIPNSLTYPLPEVLECLRDGDLDWNPAYFVSSIAYQIGLAITIGYKEIHLYGCDMVVDSEYGHQKPNCEYLLGFARGKGIKVVLPKVSAMCKHGYLYGYQVSASESGIIREDVLKLRLKTYQTEMARCLQIKEKAERDFASFDGAAQECEQLLSILMIHNRGGHLPWTNGGELAEDTFIIQRRKDPKG